MLLLLAMFLCTLLYCLIPYFCYCGKIDLIVRSGEHGLIVRVHYLRRIIEIKRIDGNDDDYGDGVVWCEVVCCAVLGH